ncbi:hypothetical protein GC197_14615 [bacterium]|nr:hypothetical protein [bacterium]
MTCSIDAFPVRAFVGVDTVVRARVVGADNAPITPAALSAAYLQIFGPDGDAVHNETLNLAETFSAALQTGAEWTTDNVGYNLTVTLPGSALVDETFAYPAVIWCVPISGSDFPIRMLVDLTPVPKATYPQ